MRRSAAMGGGGILRGVGRAAGGAGVGGAKGAVSAATAAGRTVRPARAVALPSSSSGVATATRGSVLCFFDEDEWEVVEGKEMEEGIGVPERFVFGPVPSEEEAEEAVSDIRQMFVPVTFSEEIKGSLQEQEDVKEKEISSNMLPRSFSTGSQSDWIEPSIHLYNSTSYQSREQEKVLDAFRLLQINPSVQRVVVSLSSDRAVWDAVLRNDVVKEFRKSFYEVEVKPQEANKGDDASRGRGILKWIMHAKAKIMELLEKIAKHVNQIFQSNGAKNEFDVFDDVLRSSFVLSILVFIVVIIKRNTSYA